MKHALLLAAILSLCLSAVSTADSPQFRGPDRSGIFPETGLAKSWPEGGPPVLWTATGLGEGYSSIAIMDGLIYVPGMKEPEQGSISVLNLDGTVQKTFPYGKEIGGGQAPGPRSTPAIDGDRLYIESSIGVVYCLALPEGNILWQKDLLGTFGGPMHEWNFSESVLVDGDRVICIPGGPDASVVALNKMTGETLWTSKGLSDGASYCSPKIIEHNGRRIIVTMTLKLVVGLDAESGQVLWTHTHETKYDVHAAMPVYADGILYFSAGYGSGGGALALSSDGAAAKLIWSEPELDCQHHGLVLLDGYVYGTGHNSRKLICLDLKTGNQMWSTKEVGQGVVVAADGMLYVYETKGGGIHLVKASPDGFEHAGSGKVDAGGGNHWAHPVISGKRLYVRHGDALVAYDIAAK